MKTAAYFLILLLVSFIMGCSTSEPTRPIQKTSPTEVPSVAPIESPPVEPASVAVSDPLEQERALDSAEDVFNSMDEAIAGLD